MRQAKNEGGLKNGYRKRIVEGTERGDRRNDGDLLRGKDRERKRLLDLDLSERSKFPNRRF